MRIGLVILVMACGNSTAPRPGAGSAPEAGKPAVPPTSKVGDCKAAATEVGTFLTTMDHEGSLVSLEDVSPVLRADLKLHEDGLRQAPLVEVRVDGLVYQGQRVSGSELDAKLAAAHARIRKDLVDGRFSRRDPPDPDAMIVVADGHARWMMVVTGLQSAHRAGFAHLALVFGRPSATPPPPHTKVDDEIAKLMKDTPAGNKASAFASYTTPMVAPCPALVRVFGEVSATEGMDKAAYMLSHVGPALIECDCAVDPAEIRSLMWNLAGNRHPIGVIKVALDPKAPPLVATADTLWSEASKQLAVDTTQAWFVIK